MNVSLLHGSLSGKHTSPSSFPQPFPQLCGKGDKNLKQYLKLFVYNVLEENSNIETGLRLPHRTSGRKENSTEKTAGVTLMLKPLNSIISGGKCTKFTSIEAPRRAKNEEKNKNFLTAKEKNKLSGEDLKRAIKTACHGLVFISEIDADVRPVFIEKKDASTVDNALALLTGSEKMIRTERRPDDFFLPLTSTRDWHGSIENARVRRFRDLQELLFENLTGLRQYRLGKTRLTIYVIGYDHDGNIVGITTEAVET